MNLERYGKVYNNYDLYNNNTYKLHSICDYFIIVDDVIKLTNLVLYLNQNNIKFMVIGNGSNIILPNKYNGVVIKLELNEIEYLNNKITVGSSYMLNKLAIESVNKDLKGLEWACGIPGTIGASIVSNAGAYQDEICNYIDEIEVLENNKIKLIKKNDIFFEYRFSSLKKRNLIVLKATFILKKGNKEESLSIINDRTKRRLASQPLEYPSAGSVFRNPKDNFAGKLIEDLGLKGKKIGGAEISEKHANFIINKNNATSEDIRNLIKLVHKEVYDKYNIDLVLEQEIID